MDAIQHLKVLEAEDELVDYCAEIQAGTKYDREHLRALIRNLADEWSVLDVTKEKQ